MAAGTLIFNLSNKLPNLLVDPSSIFAMVKIEKKIKGLMQKLEKSNLDDIVFSGNIFFFHAFDIGDDINLEKVEKLKSITKVPLTLPKYFKTYYTPLEIELPRPHDSARCVSTKLHSFGAISLTYQVPFNDTLDNLRKQFNELYNNYHEQSIIDAKSIFKRIERYITKSRFFQMQSAYGVIQVDPQPQIIDVKQLEQKYTGTITSMLRFETEALSEEQKKEILEDTIGYFRGDLIIVDMDVSFVYAPEYEEVIDFFEFANLQQLELKYFDKQLDKQLTRIYETESRSLPWRAYLPFIGVSADDPVTRLSKLRVDISVITERLESSIKVAGEPYFSELYNLIVKKLELKTWQESIDRKLDILREVQNIYQNKIEVTREDMLSVLVIVLIFIELVIGILSYLK